MANGKAKRPKNTKANKAVKAKAPAPKAAKKVPVPGYKPVVLGGTPKATPKKGGANSYAGRKFNE